jgi:hypothetical protein
MSAGYTRHYQNFDAKPYLEKLVRVALQALRDKEEEQ